MLRTEAPIEPATRRVRRARVAGVCVKPEEVTILVVNVEKQVEMDRIA